MLKLILATQLLDFANLMSLATFRPPPHLSECNEGSGNVAHVQKVSKHVLFEVRRGVTLTAETEPLTSVEFEPVSSRAP